LAEAVVRQNSARAESLISMISVAHATLCASPSTAESLPAFHRPLHRGLPANSRMFVCSYQEAGGSASVYKMFALDLDTGATIQCALLTDPGAMGRPTFDPNQQDQRGGLNLVNGRVYATFAAFYGYDIGNYHGWVVSCNANNLNNQWYFSTTKNVLAGGCWGPGGAAAGVDGTWYIATGNATTADNGFSAQCCRLFHEKPNGRVARHWSNCSSHRHKGCRRAMRMDCNSSAGVRLVSPALNSGIAASAMPAAEMLRKLRRFKDMAKTCYQR